MPPPEGSRPPNKYLDGKKVAIHNGWELQVPIEEKTYSVDFPIIPSSRSLNVYSWPERDPKRHTNTSSPLYIWFL